MFDNRGPIEAWDFLTSATLSVLTHFTSMIGYERGVLHTETTLSSRNKKPASQRCIDKRQFFFGWQGGRKE